MLNTSIGIPDDFLENYDRNSRHIDATWLTTHALSKDSGILLHYSTDLSKHSYSIYANHSGLSFGYFFTSGGSRGELNEGVVVFPLVQGNEYIYLSMNKQQINKMQIVDKNNIQTVAINSQKPFVFIVPNYHANVVFYDINENVIENIICHY